MNMFDEARAMSGTLELCKITQRELGERMCVSQSYIANKLRLLSYSDEAERFIVDNKISERHARAVLRLSDEEGRLNMLKKIQERSLTVRECEAMVDILVDRESPRIIENTKPPERIAAFLITLKNSISLLRSFGVEITDTRGYYGDKMYITLCISDI